MVKKPLGSDYIWKALEKELPLKKHINIKPFAKL
jgi:hypothetical protein